MLNARNLSLSLIGVVFLSCSNENGLTKAPPLAKTGEVLQRAYDRGDLRMVPYDINMKDKKLPVNEHNRIIRTMYRAKLFFGEATPDGAGARNASESNDQALAWEKQDQLVRQFLKEHEQDPFAFFYRQECAQKMLAHTDLLMDPSDKAVSAVEYYVNIMLEEGMYSPGLYFYSLSRLRGYWSDKRIQDSIHKALDERGKFEAKNLNHIALFKNKDASDPMSSEMVVYYQTVARQNQLYTVRLGKLYK